MKLTRKKALEICIELWTWLAETGREKREWGGWEKYGEMESDCPFCEFDNAGCDDCPIVESGWQDCVIMGFRDWDNSHNIEDRKKYAKIFLERLLEIK